MNVNVATWLLTMSERFCQPPNMIQSEAENFEMMSFALMSCKRDMARSTDNLQILSRQRHLLVTLTTAIAEHILQANMRGV